MNLILYAIKEKGTDNYLPSHRGTGYTFDEPELNGGKYGPRLHISKRAAINTLSAWCIGNWDKKPHYNFEKETTNFSQVVRQRTVDQKERVKETMEIISFKLVKLKYDAILIKEL